MRIILLVLLSLFSHLFSYGQSASDAFRGTLFTNFFGFKMQHLNTSSNVYYTTSSFQGKKLDKPVYHELIGELTRELKAVEFKIKLVKSNQDSGLVLIQKYYVHKQNFSKYAHLIDSSTGEWISDSTEKVDSLIAKDMLSSSINISNEIGVYYHSRTGKYYIKSNKYCALVKIRVSKLRGKRFMKQFGHKIDKRGFCLSVLGLLKYCDIKDPLNLESFNLDTNCYNLYPHESR